LALQHTQKKLQRVPEGDAEPNEPEHHVSGPELLHGIRELALLEFGMMARTVLRRWGILRTDDFGEIVFNLVKADLLKKTDDDCLADFHQVFDLDRALEDYTIEMDETVI
jgi:uncharacterized repeat protein (TIGR04138 family)